MGMNVTHTTKKRRKRNTDMERRKKERKKMLSSTELGTQRVLHQCPLYCCILKLKLTDIAAFFLSLFLSPIHSRYDDGE